MKKIIILTITLLTSPLFAGISCITNTKNLSQAYDTKEWHYANCSCDCKHEIVKGGYCTECGHLQDAQTYNIVKPVRSSRTAQLTIRIPDNPQDVLRQLAAQYLMSK